MGLSDTVKAAGILKWEISWPSNRRMLSAERIRHAISNEHRRPYREYV